MGAPDAHADGDHFETAAQFLGQLERNGNFAAREFCRHVEAMRVVMAGAARRGGGGGGGGGEGEAGAAAVTASDSSLVEGLTAATVVGGGGGSMPLGDVMPYTPGSSLVTAGMALAEPSLQEFLAQPDLSLQFIDTSIYDDGLQSLYWPDLRGGDWMDG